MNTIIRSSTASILATHKQPNFSGLVKGALLKISNLHITWIILAISLALTLLPFFISSDKPQSSLETLYILASGPWIITRSCGGIFLMVITSYLIGMEYQHGTIRVILARGVGRIQLFIAQLTAILMIELLLFIGWTIFNILGFCLITLLLKGNLDILQAANAEFWREIGLYVVTILISMTITVLMAAAMTSIGRSLTFGMTITLSWFAADNTIGLVLQNVAHVIHSDFLNGLSNYLLGPILNVLPISFGLNKLPEQGNLIYINLDGSQALLVILAYGVAFLGTSLIFTWKKDVTE